MFETLRVGGGAARGALSALTSGVLVLAAGARSVGRGTVAVPIPLVEKVLRVVARAVGLDRGGARLERILSPVEPDVPELAVFHVVILVAADAVNDLV